jgi:hypothetical protein
LQWLMEYQLVVKDIGRIMLQLKASWAWLAFNCMECYVDGPHDRHDKFLLGRDGGEALSDEVTGT